jgi:hypothetical protein
VPGVYKYCMFENRKVLKIAKTVRRTAERLVKLAPYTKSKYRWLDLGGTCGCVSLAFAKLVKKHAKKRAVVAGGWTTEEVPDGHGGGHCWVLIGGKIWDLTATQFGVKKKVLVVANRKEQRRLYHEVDRGSKTVKDIPNWSEMQFEQNLFSEADRILRRSMKRK